MLNMSIISDVEELLWNDSKPSGSGHIQASRNKFTGPSRNVLEGFAKMLDMKLEQKLSSLKRSFEDKDEQHTSEIKKLKSDAKAANSFKFKGNRIQYKFNSPVIDNVDLCSTHLKSGKRASRVILLLMSMNRMSWSTILRTRRNYVRRRRERCQRFQYLGVHPVRLNRKQTISFRQVFQLWTVWPLGKFPEVYQQLP